MIHDKIAKLPKHADPCFVPQYRTGGAFEIARYWENEAHVYRAELELAREWIGQDGCGTLCDSSIGLPCDCGRAEVLAAITPPR
jgi:hypothetical protein